MKIANYITPPSMLILTVDKLSSELFGLDDDKLNVMLKNNNTLHKFKESEPKYEENLPKGINEIITKFQLRYHDCVDDGISLTFFDQIILSVCMTEFLTGNKIITPNIIYRDLGGAKNSCCFDYKDQIQQSLQKLANLEIRLNAKDASRFLFHVKGTAFDDIRCDFVLPAEEIMVKLNGQCCKAYKLTGMSVVFEYAQCKAHVVKIPIDHLNIPHTKNTLTFMLLKIYIYTRILRIQRKLTNSKKKQPINPQSIILETMYQCCGFTEKIKHWKFRLDMMKQLTQFMDHLIKLGVIGSYQLVDNFKSPQKHLKDCTKILVVPATSD